MDIAEAEAIAAEMEQDRLAREAEAALGHDYDGPELQSGTPEYERDVAEYREWANEAENELEPGL